MNLNTAVATGSLAGGSATLKPFSLAYPAHLTARQRRGIYEAQIRAFVEASDSVDLEDDVLADILDGFEDFDVGEDVSVDDDGGPDAFHCSALMQPRWSPTEVKRMLKVLKEKGMSVFVKDYVVNKKIPIPELLSAFDIMLCEELQKKKPATLQYFLKVALSRELQMRDRLTQYNTVDDAVELIRKAQRILVLSGAGISVSCGIPDFRSKNGLYAQLKEAGQYDLDDPQEMFDIHYFRSNPAVFYSFAKQIYPSNFVPSPCHRFIKAIEDHGKLLRNYTQNIDTLETLTGVTRVLQCHGSFATASCLACRARVPGSAIESSIMSGEVPVCVTCAAAETQRRPPRPKRKRKSGGSKWDESDEEEETPTYPPWIMKPDITFFGEKLTDDFEDALIADREQVDLILVIGTSLKVSPVADILTHLPHSIPQILINKTPVRHINPDIILLGNADPIIQHLASELTWDLPPPKSATLQAPQTINGRKRSIREPQPEPQRVGSSHIWLYEGAEGGSWLEDVRAAFEEEEEESDDDIQEVSPPPPSRTPSVAATPARTLGSSISRSISAPTVRSAASLKASSKAPSASPAPVHTAAPSKATARDTKKARVR
ncbi:SIR2-domain-containing protein [Peniophora sp. CONT]|nr:SIR2-domain-containing protein [Peniophora sp. CONT]